MKLTTTLNKIRACSPCTSGWRALLKHVGEGFDPDAEINLLTVLESNGVPDMLWTLRATNQDPNRVASQLAIEFAEHSLPIFEKQHPNDERPRKAIQAARDYLDGKISPEELQVCRSHATYAGAYSYAAAYAANAAVSAAYAAYAAVSAVAVSAAYAAASAAYTGAASEKARERQEEIIRIILDPDELQAVVESAPHVALTGALEEPK